MALSGKKTVATAGMAVALGNQLVDAALQVKALGNNTGTIYIGNNGADDVSSANGMELAAGDVAIFDYVSNLAKIMLNASVNGEGVTWLILNTDKGR